MAIEHLNQFLETYFRSHHCTILDSKADMISVQLTEEMDKVLMNRPFYWHYIKKMGREGDPANLTFHTGQTLQVTEEKGEHIDYGSPRLQQILNHLKMNELYTKLFQSINTNVKTPLYPWLVVNVKVTYTGEQRREDMMSIGLNMISGMMRSNMMDSISLVDMQSTIPDFCYTLSPMIKLKSGYNRIEAVILDYIGRENHDWAQVSLKKKEEELQLLNHFYEGQKDDDEQAQQIEKERLEIEQRLSPGIQIEVVNGGIFYLAATIFQ